MKKHWLIPLTLFMLLTCSYIVSSAPSGCFTYTVEGQTVTVTPTLVDTTYYRWELDGDYYSITEWIPISDIQDHKFILNWDTKYTITLFYKNGSTIRAENQQVGIGQDPDPDNDTTITPSLETVPRYHNIMDHIPDYIKNMNTPELAVMGIIIVSVFLFLLQKRSRKTLFVPVKTKYGNRRKKTK